MARRLWQEEEGSFIGRGGEKEGLNFIIQSIFTQVLACIISTFGQLLTANQTLDQREKTPTSIYKILNK